MNFPTICIRWGLARLPLWGRGQQGRNTVAAETGSLRLEFPSCFGRSSETPSGSASPASSSSHPASTTCPSFFPGPSSSCQDTNTHSTWLPQGSALQPKPLEEGVTHTSRLLAQPHAAEPREWTPNSQSPSCDQLPLACGSRLYPTFHPGSAHLRDGETDVKLPRLDQDQPDSSDLAQLGRVWEG